MIAALLLHKIMPEVYERIVLLTLGVSKMDNFNVADLRNLQDFIASLQIGQIRFV